LKAARCQNLLLLFLPQNSLVCATVLSGQTTKNAGEGETENKANFTSTLERAPLKVKALLLIKNASDNKRTTSTELKTRSKSAIPTVITRMNTLSTTQL